MATSLRIEGYVDLGSTQATDVRVTGRCGQSVLTTVTDGEGRYTLDLDELDCDRLTIEHAKTGFLPVYRVLPVPPTEADLALHVALGEMDVLECGSELCRGEQSDTLLETGGVIARGFYAGDNGDRALDFIPPDMRTADGELTAFLGFQYFELYDQRGEVIDDTDTVNGCRRITDDGLSWVGDVDSSTPEVDLTWYRYDAQLGAWQAHFELGKLMYKRGNQFTVDDEGHCHDVKDERGEKIRELLPVQRSDMPDVRAEEYYVPDPCAVAENPDPIHVREYWMCGPVVGGGFYAYGRSAPEQSCYALHVTDDCGEPLAGVGLSVRGIEHGFLHHTFTGPTGDACVDVMASEPIGEDYDLDELGGEVFAVDLKVDGGRRGTARVDAQENSRERGSCDEPDRCIQLDEQLRGCED